MRWGECVGLGGTWSPGGAEEKGPRPPAFCKGPRVAALEQAEEVGAGPGRVEPGGG